MRKIYLVGLLTTAFLLTLTSSLWAQDNPITVPFRDPNRPGLLKVNIMSGDDVTIRAHSGRDVIIQTQASSRRPNRSGRATESEGLHRLEVVSAGLLIEEENNVMSVSTSHSNSSSMDIQVPARTNLKVNIVNGDKLLIDGVEGEIEAENTNGQITLTNVSGSVVAHSTNGNVRASMKRVSADKAMSFTSLNGNVDVTLPTDTKANLKLRTDNGDVYTDFAVQIRPAAPTQVVQRPQSGKGPYRIQVEKSVLGTINGGGPDFVLYTFTGNVYIRKAKP